MPIPLIAAGIGAVGSIGSAAIGSGAANEQRRKADEAGNYANYDKYRTDLGVTNDAFKNALAETYNSPISDVVSRSNTLMGQYGQTAAGQGPFLTDPMLQSAKDNSLAQQLALNASARGGNVGLLQRNAGINTAATNASLENSAMQNRLQEIFGARQQLASLLGQTGSLMSADSVARQQQRASLFGQALAREQAAAAAASGALAPGNAATDQYNKAIGGGIAGVGASIATIPGMAGSGGLGDALAKRV